MAKRTPKLYCVVYRTGGRERFQWHRSIADTKEATQQRLNDVRLQGYKAHMEDAKLSHSIGLPETYDPSDLVPR